MKGKRRKREMEKSFRISWGDVEVEIRGSLVDTLEAVVEDALNSMLEVEVGEKRTSTSPRKKGKSVPVIDLSKLAEENKRSGEDGDSGDD